MSTARPRVPNRREHLIEEAGHLFAEHGYGGTTVRKIAVRCGISEAAIYKHFKGKDELYDEVIRHKAREHDIAGSLETMRGKGDVEEMLHAVVTHILDTARRDPEMIRMLLFSSLEGYHGSTVLYREFRQPYVHYLREELKERRAAGEIRDMNPFITSRCFVGMVMDCALNVELWNNLEGTTCASETTVNNNVPIFARGLMRTNGAEPQAGEVYA